MIKTKTIEGVETKPKIGSSFPILGIYPQAGRIVLFTAPNTGICMEDPHKIHQVGFQSDSWLMDEYYELYNGEVVISNSNKV